MDFFYSKSEATKDSTGCQAEFAGGENLIFTTEVGERPGAISGLVREGILAARESVNLCILRTGGWAFRRGKVQLTWIPNMETMRVGRDVQDVKKVVEKLHGNTNTEEL